MLSLKAGGTGLNLTAASHVVLYDRWWNPAVEDQARDRAWRIGQTRTVICHRLICPGTVDERVEEVVAGKRRIADLVLPKSSSLADLDSDQLRAALGIRPDAVLTEDLLAADAATGVSPPRRRKAPERANARRRRAPQRDFWGSDDDGDDAGRAHPPGRGPHRDAPLAQLAAAARARDGRRALLRRGRREGGLARGRARRRLRAPRRRSTTTRPLEPA